MKKLTFYFLMFLLNTNILSANKSVDSLEKDNKKIRWELNYVCALEEAKRSSKLLLVFFCCPQFTDLYCERARKRFVNNSSFLDYMSHQFVFCLVEPKNKTSKHKENIRPAHIQFLAKLLADGSMSSIQAPSFVIINPDDQSMNSGFISSNMDDKVLTSVFNEHVLNMIKSRFL